MGQDTEEEDEMERMPELPDARVFSFENDEQMKMLKEIKVKLPVSHHIKLHSLKITRNLSISDVVMHALEDYFAKLEPHE